MKLRYLLVFFFTSINYIGFSQIDEPSFLDYSGNTGSFYSDFPSSLFENKSAVGLNFLGFESLSLTRGLAINRNPAFFAIESNHFNVFNEIDLQDLSAENSLVYKRNVLDLLHFFLSIHSSDNEDENDRKLRIALGASIVEETFSSNQNLTLVNSLLNSFLEQQDFELPENPRRHYNTIYTRMGMSLGYRFMTSDRSNLHLGLSSGLIIPHDFYLVSDNLNGSYFETSQLLSLNGSLEQYRLSSNPQSPAYSNNPLDNLSSLFKRSNGLGHFMSVSISYESGVGDGVGKDEHRFRIGLGINNIGSMSFTNTLRSRAELDDFSLSTATLESGNFVNSIFNSNNNSISDAGRTIIVLPTSLYFEVDMHLPITGFFLNFSANKFILDEADQFIMVGNTYYQLSPRWYLNNSIIETGDNRDRIFIEFPIGYNDLGEHFYYGFQTQAILGSFYGLLNWRYAPGSRQRGFGFGFGMILK